jgi:signal transduction histidine kinase
LAKAPAGQLNQVFLNLLDNALRSGSDSIRVRVVDDGDVLRISVADNGPGVPPEDAIRIFDPFFTKRADGTGTGLGLFLSRQIVEEFGGSLHLKNEPGGGARFDIRIPVFEIESKDRTEEGLDRD